MTETLRRVQRGLEGLYRVDTGVAAEITNGDIACVKLVLKNLKPV